MVTERVAGEDYSPYCCLFSAGHSFISYKLSPNGFSLSGAWSSEALVYLQVVVWVFLASTMQPMTNPYVPKRKLSSCSQWLQAWLNYTNTAFDDIATYLAPLIHVKTTHRQSRICSSSSGSTHRKATPHYRKHGAPPRNRKLALMAFSAVTAGLARVQAHCDNAGPPVARRAVFDSDSYEDCT
jgi:hypothetical protein